MDSLSRRFAIGLLLAALALSGCAPRTATPERPRPPRRLDVRKEIDSFLSGGAANLGLADTAGSGAAWTRAAALYGARHHRPIWGDGRTLAPTADALLEAVARTPRLGLDSSRYEIGPLRQLRGIADRGDSAALALRPRTLARFDVRATFAWLRLLSDLRHGQLPGDTLDTDWTRRDEPGFWRAQIEGIGRDDPRVAVDSLEPRHPQVRLLEQALARYRAVAAAGGWLAIPPGPPIGHGARGLRVARLVRRLAATGELPVPVTDTVMDARLERAVGEFQTRNGIPRSGVVGEATRAALDVPAAERIRTIELNLERWRWLPADLGTRHVMVNIPAFRLDLVRNDSSVRTLRVVVGKKESPTPVFSDRLRYLELNPTWTLPPSVVFKEILPALHRQPDYLARNGMVIVPLTSAARRDTLDPAAIPWKKLSPDSFPYLIIQGAGPTNPLGRIKLMCPNEYDVYLHDTPLREKFSDAARAYSHGCVRVAGATELADSLLDRAAGDSVALDTMIATGTWKRISLPHPVPVHVAYWTAWCDSSGIVSFRPDLYGLDARLDRTLRDRSVPFELNPGVSMSPFWLAAHGRPVPKAAPDSAAAIAARRHQGSSPR